MGNMNIGLDFNTMTKVFMSELEKVQEGERERIKESTLKYLTQGLPEEAASILANLDEKLADQAQIILKIIETNNLRITYELNKEHP
jgi:hypothetical protein